PYTAMALYNLAEVLYAVADHRAALGRYQRALVSFEKLEPGDPEIAGLHDRMARCHLALGAPARALAEVERAAAICAKAECSAEEKKEEAAIRAEAGRRRGRSRDPREQAGGRLVHGRRLRDGGHRAAPLG